MKLYEVKLFHPEPGFPKGGKPGAGSTFRGVTLIAHDHTHKFQMQFDQGGKVTGGSTLKDDTGHTHGIRQMEKTETADGHFHRLPIPGGGAGGGGGGAG